MGKMVPLPRGDDPRSKQIRKALVEDQARADAYGCVALILVCLALAVLAFTLHAGGAW